MQTITDTLKKHPIWVSLLAHSFFLLLVAIFSFLNKRQLKQAEITAEIYVPSFIYQPNAHISNTPAMQQNLLTAKDSEKPFKDLLRDEDGLEKLSQPQSLANYIPQQRYQVRQPKKFEDPVHVIGEKLMDDPLRKLLGVALTKHLIYPRAARQLELRGVVSVELILHPSGEISQIKLLKSSQESLLDVAALNAIHAMSPVQNIDLYIKEPKVFVFNVFFR